MWLCGLFVAARLKKTRLQTKKFAWAERRSWSYIKVETKGPNGADLRTLKNLESSKDEEEVCLLLDGKAVCAVWKDTMYEAVVVE